MGLNADDERWAALQAHQLCAGRDPVPAIVVLEAIRITMMTERARKPVVPSMEVREMYPEEKSEWTSRSRLAQSASAPERAEVDADEHEEE